MAMNLAISKPGVDVLTATSPNDFFLNANYPLLKIHSFGTFSFTTATGGTTIYHNLGYKPFALVFSQFSDFNFSTSTETKTNEFYHHDWNVEGATWEWWGTTKIYDDRIRIDVGNTGSGSPLQIQGFYYIFKDEV